MLVYRYAFCCACFWGLCVLVATTVCLVLSVSFFLVHKRVVHSLPGGKQTERTQFRQSNGPENMSLSDSLWRASPQPGQLFRSLRASTTCAICLLLVFRWTKHCPCDCLLLKELDSFPVKWFLALLRLLSQCGQVYYSALSITLLPACAFQFTRRTLTSL